MLNRDSEISAVFAGELEAAHLEATKLAHNQFATNIDEQADIVIAASTFT